MSQPTEPTRRQFVTGYASDPTSRTEPDSSNRHETAAPVAGPLASFSQRAMACDFEILCQLRDQKSFSESIVDGFGLLQRLENQLSVFRDNSEVSDINRLAGSQPVIVEQRLFTLLDQAQEIARRTSGAFDITTTPLSKLWGFHRRQGRVPEKHQIDEVRNSVGYQAVQLNAMQRSIKFSLAEIEIDLGGIGKGHAIDRLGEFLVNQGNSSFAIHGGQSSVACQGSGPGEGWTIALTDPLKSGARLGLIRLCDQALGTSGSARQSFVHRGQRFSHILDPRTGWPAQQVLSATVVAPTAAEADAMATALFVLGPEGAEQITGQHPRLSAILISDPTLSGHLQIDTFNMLGDQLALL